MEVEKVALLFIAIILSIPAYGFLIWSLYEPDEAAFFLDKWRYKEVPELSDLQKKLNKIANIVLIILLTIVLIALAIDAFTPEPPIPDMEEYDWDY